MQNKLIIPIASNNLAQKAYIIFDFFDLKILGEFLERNRKQKQTKHDRYIR